MADLLSWSPARTFLCQAESGPEPDHLVPGSKEPLDLVWWLCTKAGAEIQGLEIFRP